MKPNYTLLEKETLKAKPRGLQSVRFWTKLFSTTKNRIENNTEYPEQIKTVMPDMDLIEIKREAISGRVVCINNLVCVENQDLQAIDTNYTVTADERSVLASNVFRVMDGGEVKYPGKEIKVSALGFTKGNDKESREKEAALIQFRVGNRNISLLEVAETLSNPGILNGVRGESLDNKNERNTQDLINNTQDYRELVLFKKMYPRASALMSINKSLNLAFKDGKTVIFNNVKAVEASSLEDSLTPERIQHTMKKSKTIDRHDLDIGMDV